MSTYNLSFDEAMKNVENSKSQSDPHMLRIRWVFVDDN